MKKAISLISIVCLFSGCASMPKTRGPADSSYEKLVRAKKIECFSSKSAGLFVTDQGDLKIETDTFIEEYEEEGPWRIQISLPSGSDRATINLDIEGHEDPGIPLTYTSLVQQWDEGISFITELPDLGIVTITIFDNRRYGIFSPDTDDLISDYEAMLSGHIKLFGPGNLNIFGSCEIVE